MHCPYCQKPVAEESTQCAACGLDLEKLDSVLGIAPVIAAGLNDRGGVLRGAEARKVKLAISQFCDRFPQILLAVVFDETATVVPLRTWVWWLFNRGNFSAALDKGFVNRDLLLVIDPARRQAALTIGYGLEPFVSVRDLSAALDAGTPALAACEWADACGQILATLDQAMAVIIGRMPQTYGVPVPLLTPADGSAETASATW
jgi:hypothetical protein